MKFTQDDVGCDVVIHGVMLYPCRKLVGLSLDASGNQWCHISNGHGGSDQLLATSVDRLTQPAKFTDKDIGMGVRITDDPHYKGYEGNLFAVHPDGCVTVEILYPTSMKGAVWTGLADKVEKGQTAWLSTGPVKDAIEEDNSCDECSGTGFIELFMGPSPCSKGCKA